MPIAALQLTQQDEASCLLHLATIKSEKGQLSDAEQWLQVGGCEQVWGCWEMQMQNRGCLKCVQHAC